MKNYFLVTLLLLAMACSTPQKSDTNEPLQLNWLEGNWVRTNDSQAEITYEQWTKKSDKEYIGRGYTIQIDSSIFEPDTVFMEELRIRVINDTLTYEVNGVNDAPTLFKFIEQTDTSFVCVNPENDFPKKISYILNKGHMTAVISGRGPDVSFIFRKE